MSPTNNVACPERDQLIQFLLGQLTEPELQAVERHLSACDACGDTLHELDAVDTLVEFARSASEELPETEMVESLIARVRKLTSGSASGTEISTPSADRATDERAEGIRSLFAPPEQPDELGRLAEYRVLGHLGTGGMGVVFEAQDERLKRTVALKILPPSLGAGARGRFLQEARAAAAIDHDNVVTIYQVGEDRGLAFLAMQRLEGETLESLIKREGTLPADRIIEIGKQLALGLRAAHSKGLIHRDVKPANIWLQSGRDRVKLLDFGVARILDDEPQLTESGMVVGTPAYMSPEQAVGEPSDERSDLFALGCVLYRLATGKLPFEGANALAMLRAIQTASPDPPEELNPELPRPLAELVMSLLEKEPECRPESADIVVEMLRRIDEGTSLAEIMSSPVARRKRAGRQKPTTATRTRSTKARAVLGWGSFVTLLVLLGVWGYSAAPTVIRIVMNRGQLVIESTDPNVKIEILQGGQVARVVDLRTEQSLDLTVGEYGIKVADESGGWSLSAKELTLTRGGTETLKVWRESPTVGSASIAMDTSAAPTYNGKTLAHYLSQLKSERNPEHLDEAMRGLTVLVNQESAEEVIGAIFQVMREFGLENRFNRNPREKLVVASYQALWGLPPATVIPAMLEEITSGNENSRAFLICLVHPPTPTPPEFDKQRVNRLADGIRKRVNEITSATLPQSRDDSSQTKLWALKFLSQLLEANEIDPAEVEGLIPRFQEELAGRDAAAIVTVSDALIAHAPDSPGLVDALVYGSSDKDPSTSTIAILGLGKLGSRAAPAVPALVDLLTEQLKSLASLSEGQPGSDIVARHRDGYRLILIVQTLGQIGPDARAALPLLVGLLSGESIPPDSEEIRKFAISKTSSIKTAISQIKADGSTPSTGHPTHIPDGEEAVNVPRPVDTAPSGMGSSAEEGLDASGAPTYDGKALEYWLAQFKSERNPERLTEAVRAVTVLGNEESTPDAAEAVFRLMREYGSLSIGGDPRGKLIEASRQALWELPPDALIPAMLEEITNGSDKSREFMIWMVVRPTASMGYDMERVEDLADGMRRRADEIASALLAISRDEDGRTRVCALSLLSQFCLANEIDPTEVEGLIPRFQEELSNRDVSAVMAVSGTLLKSAPDSPGLVDALLGLLSDEDAGIRHRAIKQLGQLGSQAAPAVPRLVDLLTEYLKPQPSSTKTPPYLIAAYYGMGGQQPDLRREIIQTLAKIGPAARPALPLLADVVTMDHSRADNIRADAQKAISEIEAAGQDDI